MIERTAFRNSSGRPQVVMTALMLGLTWPGAVAGVTSSRIEVI
ncbi:hypothetical protein [Glutamicibacter sp. NPDC087344]